MQLAVPSGFEGPQVQVPAPGVRMEAYVRPLPGSERGTLLQVTSVVVPGGGESVDSTRVHAADACLAQFLSGVERRRQDFAVVQRDTTTLSGLPAARAAWRGRVEGHEMSGTMYCVVVGTRLVTFHAQTFADAPENDLRAAVSAIESVVLRP